MNEHKHNPCYGGSWAYRYFEFLFHPMKYIDLKSKTGYCEKCKKHIVPPNIALYWTWLPVMFSTLFFIFLKPLSKLPLSLIIVVLISTLLFIGWLVPAAILAFGEWKDEKPVEMTDEEYIAQRVKGRYRRREEFGQRWELKVSMALTVLIWIAMLIFYRNPFA